MFTARYGLDALNQITFRLLKVKQGAVMRLHDELTALEAAVLAVVVLFTSHWRM
jgi:hypothetical protein